jgi:HPr kinase/phosphorylase
MVAAERKHIPLFRTPLITMKFINKATLALEAMFAPRGSEHGSMVDIHGMGVVIKGASGVGKSECVLALIERGYNFVADDVVKVRVHDGCEILATSANLLGALIEVRGIGIVDVEKMFGVKAVRDEKRVDLVVSLKPWNDVEDVDRLGIDQQFTEILGIKIPHVIIPVLPGRDLARLVEVAAFQLKLRKRGHNAGQDLDDRLLKTIQAAATSKPPDPAATSLAQRPPPSGTDPVRPRS